MPIVSRCVEPKYLSRKSLFDENGRSLVNDYELEAIANNTLTNVLRQLSSLVLVADDIFADLAKQLRDVYERSCNLKVAIGSLQEKLVRVDPKKVTVRIRFRPGFHSERSVEGIVRMQGRRFDDWQKSRSRRKGGSSAESDICAFSLRGTHFKSSHPLATGLFTAASRPNHLQKLYESAVPTPIHTIRQLDKFRRDGARSSKFFLCTPILGGRKKKFKKVDLEIETRKPVAVEDLRRWTSTEALGDITVLPDNTSKITTAERKDGNDQDEIDHLLPSPEEQSMAVALKFPSSIVAVDISGKPFDRMSVMRRSLTAGDEIGGMENGVAAKRKTKKRHRGKRRNTIAGTSQKEIEQAIAGETATETEGCEFEPVPPIRSKSTDLNKSFKLSNLSAADNFKNHFNTLKNWSKTKLKLIGRNNSSPESSRPSFQGTDVVDDLGVYESVPTGSSKRREKDRKRNSGSNAILVPASNSSTATNSVVKLRENSLEKRHWRKGPSKGQDEPAHSSSGNWSASSESGRTSIASETTAPPKSSTTTSNNSLNHNNPHHHSNNHHHHHQYQQQQQQQHPPSAQSRRRYLNTSTSSSVSEGTLTPDINDMQYHDLLDGETSSIYSCDTEGYYTSFHVDSGLKTLKEEEIALSFSTLQLQEVSGSSAAPFNNTSSSGSGSVKANQLTAENEYELFGKGSTSTTTSSAGTVCTTLPAGNNQGSTRSLSQFAPAVPERKSSLERKSERKKMGREETAVERNDGGTAGVHESPSPDSGRNTSSSPAETASQNSQSPHEQTEFSESDLESCDRTERIRTKTEMTSSRIPSMCLITPPQSDDEVNLRNRNRVPCETRINRGKPLHIEIPTVPDAKPDAGDVCAFPGKSGKNESDRGVETVSGNGSFENDAFRFVVNVETAYATLESDSGKTGRVSGGGNAIPEGKPSTFPVGYVDGSRKVVGNRAKQDDDGDYVAISGRRRFTAAESAGKSEYVSLNELPRASSPGGNAPEEGSLERKRRQGARVTLDSEGRVVYSSDSLGRKKPQTTFEPGKYVRPSPDTSPMASKRPVKPVRPVNCSGLVRTNSDGRNTPETRSACPRTEKLVIRAGSKLADSPAMDFVRILPNRIVAASDAKNRNFADRGIRVTAENGTEAKNGSPSPPSSESSSRGRNGKGELVSSAAEVWRRKRMDATAEDEGTFPSSRWISRHPAVSENRPLFSRTGFPRNHPMYWTLPARSVYAESSKRSDRDRESNGKNSIGNLNNKTSGSSFSGRGTGSMEQSSGTSPNLKSIPNLKRNEFTSSTPTKGPLRNSNAVNLGCGMSPISKENNFGSKSKMTADEIFAAIHKSKKKLNLKEDSENRSRSPGSSKSTSPDGSEKSAPNKIGDRSSWSPNGSDSESKLMEPRSRRSWIGAGATPMNSFKKLLLQQGIKASPSKDARISAVEQLKLSREEVGGGGGGNRDPRQAPRGISNGRSTNVRHQWRFASPRTDILSSTIPEDCGEVEKTEDGDVGSRSPVESERSSSRFARSDVSDRVNPRDSDDSRMCAGNGCGRKTDEIRSLEATRKYLRQARNDFFGETSSAKTIATTSATVSGRRLEVLPNLGKPNNSVGPVLNCSDSRRKSAVVSLETAL